ncbi:MAG: DUF3306 domain-containing protein [Hyphomicrobiales bacterium]|nr:DUF3306 domain-containing protein [Hyphomicrobiales bacterium]
MSTKKTDDGFLSRWSRRKLKTKAAPEPEADEQAEERSAGEEPAPPAAASDAPAEASQESAGAEKAPPELTEEDVEKLGPGSDYTVFMKRGVPARIRRLALRKLWRSNPIYSYHDGLTDYADDYRGEAAASLGKVVTSWKPGKGLLSGGETDGRDDAPAAAEPEDDVADAAPAAEAEAAEEGEESATEPAPDGGDDVEKA